jgi:hypothetical protein
MSYDGAYKDSLIISLIDLDYTQQQQVSNGTTMSNSTIVLESLTIPERPILREKL